MQHLKGSEIKLVANGRLNRVCFIIFLVPILFFAQNAKAQSDCDCYERLSNLSAFELSQGQQEKALRTYQRALTFLPVTGYTYMNDLRLADLYAQHNLLDSATVMLTTAIKKGWPKQNLLNNLHFSALSQTAPFKEVIDSAFFQPGPNYDWDLYRKVAALRGFQQAYMARGDFGSVSPDSIRVYGLSQVAAKAIELIHLNGIPNESEHGFSENFTFAFHFAALINEAEMDHFEFAFQKAHESCQCEKGVVATFEDQKALRSSQPQPNGTWNYPDSIQSVLDPMAVDLNRFEFNLLTLYDYAIESGRILPVGYIRLPYPDGYFCENRIPE